MDLPPDMGQIDETYRHDQAREYLPPRARPLGATGRHNQGTQAYGQDNAGNTQLSHKSREAVFRDLGAEQPLEVALRGEDPSQQRPDCHNAPACNQALIETVRRGSIEETLKPKGGQDRQGNSDEVEGFTWPAKVVDKRQLRYDCVERSVFARGEEGAHDQHTAGKGRQHPAPWIAEG
jgi:hypothetical protein